MLKITYVNTGQYLIFPEPDDFKLWVQGMKLSYKPYQLWNLNNATLYVGVFNYIGTKYLGELIIHKSEQRTKALLQKRYEKRIKECA